MTCAAKQGQQEMATGKAPSGGLLGRSEGMIQATREEADRWRTARLRLVLDAAAGHVVTLGGIGVIVCILGMVAFIGWEALPLLEAARVHPGRSLSLHPSVAGGVTDEYRTHLATLGTDGTYRVYRMSDGQQVFARSLGVDASKPEDSVALPVIEQVLGGGFVAATADGRVLVVQPTFEVIWKDGKRTVHPAEPALAEAVLDPGGTPVQVVGASLEEGGGAVAAGQLRNGKIAVARIVREENPFTGEVVQHTSRGEGEAAAALRRLLVGNAGRNLYGFTENNELLWWAVEGAVPVLRERRRLDGPRVTAAALLQGGRSLVVGREDGAVEVWFVVTRKDEAHLLRARDLGRRRAPVRFFVPGTRNKLFFSYDDAGDLVLQHATSERVLWQGPAPGSRLRGGAFSPKGDGAVFSAVGKAVEFDVRARHPEVSWRTLFGRVWYEGYPEPAFVWQSTGGTDRFEPKLSLTPLVFGTVKGTVYALILAVPLGVFGAVYAAQFMHPRLRGRIKPVVEIMAALPSVVLGFLAGLWLAPRLERHLMALFLMVPILLGAVLAAAAAWRRIPPAVRSRWRPGSEIGVMVVVLLASMWVCFTVGPHLEQALLGTSAPRWIHDTLGLSYDQRNAVVVGLAMGFAVIPIIFAIAEDALSAVPGHLVAGSLALGATRWQTVTRVVLPTASPGIFSAMIVGFGRAVGETMIVLMATGNTPIMDWNPFTGFRTLSANIAVEIPEAPQHGTLYRVLFLSALLLFLMTFAANTAAEIVRQRLRKRYAQL